MWIELHPIAVSHRQLALRRASGGSSAGRIPGPDFVRIELVELSLQAPCNNVALVTLEVAINVVRMIFLFDERAVDEYLLDADLPELVDEDLKIVDEPCAPHAVPGWRADPLTSDDV